MMEERRFFNDMRGFETVWLKQVRGGGARRAWRWIRGKWNGLAVREKRFLDSRSLPGARGLSRAVRFARGAWIYAVSYDVWRFDTGGGKRIAGLAGAIARRHPVLIATMRDSPAIPDFRMLERGVGVVGLTKPAGFAGLGTWRNCGWGEWGCRDAFCEMGARARGWILDNPCFDEALRENGLCQGRILYDSVNQFVHFFGKDAEEKGHLATVERTTMERAEKVFFCTQADMEAARHLHTGLDAAGWSVLPNGIAGREARHPSLPSQSMANRKRLGWDGAVVLFAGPNYRPNYEAVEEISRDWAPRHPDATFVVLGMRADRFFRDGGAMPPPNVLFTGLVSEEEKEALYELADVAIMPLKTGTGSSLKVPEALARGKIVIGSPVGLRGFHEWADRRSVFMEEHGAGILGRILERLEVEPRCYDAACRSAAERIQQTHSWPALLDQAGYHGW